MTGLPVIEAMVRSMTPFERTHSKQINGSRRLRIAKGSGVEVSEVNGLLERFTEAQKMMKQLARGGGLPGMPGMPGMGGGKRGKQQPQRKKSKSGNPAKRAAEERAAAEKASAAKSAGGGSAFGGGAGDGGLPADLDPNQLPAGFEKFLGR
jgi:signal recognition particle subunit SRP54